MATLQQKQMYNILQCAEVWKSTDLHL